MFAPASRKEASLLTTGVTGGREAAAAALASGKSFVARLAAADAATTCSRSPILLLLLLLLLISRDGSSLWIEMTPLASVTRLLLLPLLLASLGAAIDVAGSAVKGVPREAVVVKVGDGG